MGEFGIKKIIICIPTYNREKELKRLLKSLMNQEDIPKDYIFEVLIINNNKVNYLESVLDEIKSSPFFIHCINVKQRGFANVRNAAVSWVLETDADGLIFVDDDELLPHDWLDKMISARDKYKGDIITGPVVQILPSSASRFGKMFHFFETDSNTKSGDKLQYANSNNTLVSRKVLEVLGPTFHPSLNRSGGEDTLYFHQAYLKGFSIYWDTSILIKEPTIPERATTNYVLNRWFHRGMNRIVFHKIIYPEDWINISVKLILKIAVNTFRGFAVSIVKLDRRKFGNSVCRLAWLGGNILRLLGLTTINGIYNK
ncbi:MAG: glycosyltransferase family 2 protein [Pseudomonadota bacterium]